jgi:polysaccharide deacetylase family protein (PEP-CTERM system associated)
MESGPIILSFDVEEHHRIEAAAGYNCPDSQRAYYSGRMEVMTRKLIELLAEYDVKATFFIVAQIAAQRPKLVRDISAAGHEIASHSWDHRRVHGFSPAAFASDVRQSRDALEQATGIAVRGFRAPTFSIVRQTAWAIDVLAQAGLDYDSSIFPVRHDRYGIPEAPRTPFMAVGALGRIVELPPVTLRYLRFNVPVAGGGYFRLFPLAVLEAGVRQMHRLQPAAAMLYFHPWEFDPDQRRLPLSRLSSWRTYVGTHRSTARFRRLLSRHKFQRAIEFVEGLRKQSLPEFAVM